MILTGAPYFYVLDEHGQPRAVADTEIWMTWYFGTDRRVARDQVGEALVATDFVGVYQGGDAGGAPLLWETAIFDRDEIRSCASYASREAALAGHADAVAQVRARPR